MSDGMRDSRITGDLADDVDLKAHALGKAVKRAKEGHRGLVPMNILEIANDALKRFGLKLVEKE